MAIPTDIPKAPEHCSFCKKHKSQVKAMIPAVGVSICDECVRTCFAILEEKEENSKENKAWESWPSEVTNEERIAFYDKYGSISDINVESLYQLLGKPDEVVGGGGICTDPQSGRFTIADYDARFHSIMPHVVLSVSVKNNIARKASFMPKWKSCPESRRKEMGKWYAPE